MDNKSHKEHGKLCKRKREEGNKRFREEVEKANHREVINREKGKGEEVNMVIKMEEWTDFLKGFKDLVELWKRE